MIHRSAVGDFEVLRADPGVTIQDAGRPGKLAWGVPPSGPLDPTAHAAANLAVGNPSGAAAIEIPLGGLMLLARSAIVTSIDGEPARRLAPGETLGVEAVTRAVRYLAVAGGIDVPIVLGARATLLGAGFGGLDGRALRAGDVLAVERRGDGAALLVDRAQADLFRASVDEPPNPAILYVTPGPQPERFSSASMVALMENSWSISKLGDRVGVRLDGKKLPCGDRDDPSSASHGDRDAPIPMIRGAVQVARDGTPVILGPDHPVTGGYPVIATLGRGAQITLARLRPGRSVRIAPAGPTP